MKPRLVKLTLISSCALMSLQVAAQASESPRKASASVAAEAPAGASKVIAAANVRAVTSTPTATVSPAGSPNVLADGIVANARAPQVRPPAPGFEYER